MLLLLLLAVVTEAQTVFMNASEVVWTDWDRRQVCHPGLVLQPTSVQMLESFVAAAAASGQQLKVTGAGHSFSPITLTDPQWDGKALMVNLDKLDAVLQLPTPSDLTVLVEAGIRVHDLNAALLAAAPAPGYALINTGAIAMQSVAGVTTPPSPNHSVFR